MRVWMALVVFGMGLLASPPMAAADPVYVDVRPLRVVFDKGNRAGYLTTVLRFESKVKALKACVKMPNLVAGLVHDLFATAAAVTPASKDAPPRLNPQAMVARFGRVAQRVLGPDMGGRVYVVSGMVPKKNVQRQGYPFPQPINCGQLLRERKGRG